VGWSAALVPDKKPQYADALAARRIRNGQQQRLLSAVGSISSCASSSYARPERIPFSVRDPYAVQGPPDHPYTVNLAGQDFTVGYDAAESATGLFGGNSNWRGPVWFPVNHLIVEGCGATTTSSVTTS